MSELGPVLAALRPSPKLLGMDSNLHHTLWNPPKYTHCHREVEVLIALMNKAGLLLRSEPGIPTFMSNQSHNCQTTVDLQCHSTECHDWATVCRTEKDFDHSHFSDHAAITTKDLPTNPLTNIPPRTRLNWSKTDWEGYRSTLTPLLPPILRELANGPLDRGVDNLAESITVAIEEGISKSTPVLKITQRSKYWWCATTLNPLKGHATNLQPRSQRSGRPEDNVLYQAAQHKYQQACKEAKINHWRTYLSQLSDKDLFTAARYTNGPTPARTLPSLKRKDGQLTSIPSEQADLLFKATGGPTVPCDLSDIPDQPAGTGWTPPFTTDNFLSSISKLILGKSSGPDSIINAAIKKSPKELATALAELLNACVASGSYPSSWKRANTVILKKPDKPEYTRTSAYIPIALLSCLSKVLEATLAAHMKKCAEEQHISPEGHYGGRAQQSMSDALLQLTIWTR